MFNVLMILCFFSYLLTFLTSMVTVDHAENCSYRFW